MKKFYFLSTLLLILFFVPATAQVLTVSGTDHSIDAISRANDHLVPDANTGNLNADFDTCDVPSQPFTAGLLGNDHAFFCDAFARQKKYSTPQSVTTAQGFNYGKINGDNTSTLSIGWDIEARSFTNSLDGYSAQSYAITDFTINFNVTGINPGTAVTVYYKYSIFGASLTDHEGISEDPAHATNVFTINGNDEIGSDFNFTNPGGLSGWNNRVDVTGQINTTAGTDIAVVVGADLAARTELQGEPYGFGSTVDQASSVFWGELEFRLSGSYIAGSGNTLGNGRVLFSVDIGSDGELSDPTLDLNEVFDPGDAYVMGGPSLPSGGADGVIDDLVPFGVDPNPNPPDGPPASTGAPTGSGANPLNVQNSYLDMDGLDNLETDLTGLTFGPGIGPLSVFPDACIHDTRFVFISYDDDDSLHYVSAPLAESVPVNSLSPFAADIYGTTPNQDEVIELNYGPTVPAALLFTFPLYDEVMVHPNMAPNPDGNNAVDDDVDALDMSVDATSCNHVYFSVDHEATYTDPGSGSDLDPGSIYLAGSGSVTEVVNANTHLGLAAGVDVDAFEFAWIFDNVSNANAFGLLFSMDDNDPLTVPDESGGLDPRDLYYSFLDGTYGLFSLAPLNDDVDAISTYPNSLNGTPGGGTTGYNNIVPQYAGISVYPNPFTHITTLNYFVNQTSRVIIEIFDATGRKVAEPVNGLKPAGSWKTDWNATATDGEKLSEGIYLCRMSYTFEGKQQSITERIILTK